MENNIGIDYLRLSLTDRCNLNCLYCTPLSKAKFLSRGEVLNYEEIAKITALFVKAGIRKVRLTGGEPLIKKNIIGLIRMLKKIKEIEELAMTTNGVYLPDFAGRLKASGLDRVNISIDTLKRKKFKEITGFDYFEKVWSGIQESLRAGLNPVKLNVILMHGINDDEILDFAKLTFNYPLVVRFIEYFPANKRSAALIDCLIKTSQAKETITDCFGEFRNIPAVRGNGPAEYFKLKNAKGLIGFISGSSSDFCDSCNRVRVDCAGMVSPCLFSGPIADIKPLLRNNASEETIVSAIKGILRIKLNYRKSTAASNQLEMSSIGG